MSDDPRADMTTLGLLYGPTGTGELRRLSKPFPDRYVKSNPNGFGSYVKHSLVVERILAVCGGMSWEIVDVYRGDVPGYTDKKGKEFPDLKHVVVGCLGRLTLTVDGVRNSVDGAGDCEQPHNWGHDGARLKDAESDAFKRAAMRGWGIAIDLWSQELSFLERALAPKEGVDDA